MEESRQCSSCKVCKTYDNFLKKDKLMKTCQNCRDYQFNNRDVLIANRNPEAVKKTRKKNYMKNQAYYAETNKAFREANPDYSKEYYQNRKSSA